VFIVLINAQSINSENQESLGAPKLRQGGMEIACDAGSDAVD
jgi:hypothetical protein